MILLGLYLCHTYSVFFIKKVMSVFDFFSDVGLNSIDGVQVKIGDDFIPPKKVYQNSHTHTHTNTHTCLVKYMQTHTHTHTHTLLMCNVTLSVKLKNFHINIMIMQIYQRTVASKAIHRHCIIK